MSEVSVATSFGRKSPSKSPLKKVPAANAGELENPHEENNCDSSSSNILDTTEGILKPDHEEHQSDFLKFNFSRRKNMAINFGLFKKVNLNTFPPEVIQPLESDTGKTYFVGPDCIF